ncbi:hypothetical protein C8R45DRAFT_943198 [Mycena sanguinolenta]|nr:hypothetical protein C8R45DRAFT_943198 [Mycena sanguinolenta]
MAPRSLTQLTSGDAYILGGWVWDHLRAHWNRTTYLLPPGSLYMLRSVPSSKRDSIWLKIFVAGLALMTVVRCCQCLGIMWIQNVTMFANVEGASQMWARHWLSKTDVILEATGAIYVQFFFCHRLWASTLFTPLHACTVLIQHTDNISERHDNDSWLGPSVQVAIHLGIVLCGDLLLTGSTVFYLLRHYNASVLSRSPFAIKMKLLLRLTIQSAAPAAMSALTNFVVELQVYLAKVMAPQSLTVAFITNLTIPQLYAWSAIWTLNSREDIWVAVDNRPYTVTLGTSVFAWVDSETVNGPHVDANGTVTRQKTQNNCARGKG